MTIYRILILMHVLSAFVFIMAHGVNAMVMLLMPSQRDRNRICFLLEMSRKAIVPAMRSLDVVLLTGVAMMVMAGWYRYAWVWISLGLIFALGYFMGKFGATYLGRVRHAMGMPKMKKGKIVKEYVATNLEELLMVLDTGRPKLLASIGLGGLATILVMMMWKPF